MNRHTALEHVWTSALTTVTVLAVGAAGFFILEPAVGQADEDQFLVNQTIVSELSFIASTSDVTMNPSSLNGLTGGFSTGTTEVRIRTNNSAGYRMDMRFSSATAMNRTDGNGEIQNYSLATATTAPDYTFSLGTEGEFAYTVLASSSGDVHRNFLDNGTNCNIDGGSATLNRCWMTPSTTDFRIINRQSETPQSGATTTVKFKIAIPNNPTTPIPNGTYQATVTLTAVTN